MNKKAYFQIESYNNVTRETLGTRTIAVPADLYAPFLDVLDYLAGPLHELFGDDVEVIVGDENALVECKTFSVAITRTNPN